MAFDMLRPHQSQILGLIDQGRTLAQIVDILAAQHGVTTTPGTLSRFASSLRQGITARRPDPMPAAPPQPAPELTGAQHARVDDIALKTELLAELHASRTESRDILEHLAGKVAGLSADIGELETAIGRQGQQLQEQVKAELSMLATPPEAGEPLETISVPAHVLMRIWFRAFIVTGLFWAVIVAMALFVAQIGGGIQ